MSILDDVFNAGVGAVEDMLVGKTIAGVTITKQSLQDAVTVIKAVPVSDLETLLTDLGNVDNEFDITERVAAALASFGVPFAGEVEVGLEVAQWIVNNAQPLTVTTADNPPANKGPGNGDPLGIQGR